MAAGHEIHLDDLPVELQGEKPAAANDWEHALANWARAELAAGRSGLGESATRRMETVLIRAALDRSGGHRQEAARLLGWSRNTLTRKIRDLGIEA